MIKESIISLYKEKIDPNAKNIEWIIKSCLSGMNRPYPLDSELFLLFLQSCKDKQSLQNLIQSYYKCNLINPALKYYHSALNIIPSVKKYEDEDGNLITAPGNEKIKTRNFIRYKDILGYLKKKASYLYIDEKRDINACHHLLSKIIPAKLLSLTTNLKKEYFSVYDETTRSYIKIPYQSLDVLMFAIDATTTYYKLNDLKISGIFDVEKFIEQGFVMYCDKINNIIEDEKWSRQTELNQID